MLYSEWPFAVRAKFAAYAESMWRRMEGMVLNLPVEGFPPGSHVVRGFSRKPIGDWVVFRVDLSVEDIFGNAHLDAHRREVRARTNATFMFLLRDEGVLVWSPESLSC